MLAQILNVARPSEIRNHENGGQPPKKGPKNCFYLDSFDANSCRQCSSLDFSPQKVFDPFEVISTV